MVSTLDVLQARSQMKLTRQIALSCLTMVTKEKTKSTMTTAAMEAQRDSVC